VAERRALVTGAAGFFGSAIVRALTRDGIAVVATDRVPSADFASRPDTSPELVGYVARDVEREPLEDLVATVDVVVHAAALTPADESDGETGDALLRVNLAPLPGLLGAVRTSPRCNRLVFVSSAGVYDQGRDGVLREEDADGGASLYGAAKLAAELVVKRYGALYGLDTVSIRPTSLYGAGELPRASRPGVTSLARLVGHARRGEAVRVEDLDARADWLSVDDAADAVVLLCRAPSLDGRSYSLSCGSPRPFRDVVEAVRNAASLIVDPAAEHCVRAGGDRPAMIANDRIVETLGWRPARTLEDGAGDLVAYLDAVEART
jgi:nucleoside-diphosphate-sugar epimerase